MADVLIREIPIGELGRYASVSIAFEVASVFRVEAMDRGLGGLLLKEQLLDEPYIKDYDSIEGEAPTSWPLRFDTTRWAFFLAEAGEEPVGGAAVAFDTPGVHMLAERRDLAVLWDIRVAPDWRGRGVGAKLFSTAADWARRRGCKQFKIETQNVNVRACRFYHAMGCHLGEINRYAYASQAALADEVMLIWYRDL